MNKQYKITTEQVSGGYDLIVSDGLSQATLYIYDESQAKELGERLITIAIDQKIDINAATAIFNQGSCMFNNDQIGE